MTSGKTMGRKSNDKLMFTLSLIIPSVLMFIVFTAVILLPNDRSKLPTYRGIEKLNDEVVHLVFSTDCSGYQHWQGIALWYAAQEAGHRGPITRIASGCDDDDIQRIETEWRAIDPSGRFRVHFTPHMELAEKGPGGNTRVLGYKYSNKPGGLNHWLSYAKPPIQENYVVLVDPVTPCQSIL